MERDGGAGRVLLWQSLLLGLFGTVSGAVVAVMTAGVLNSANVHLPLPLELFLVSSTQKLSVLPEALGGAAAIVFAVTALAGLYQVRFKCAAPPSRCG